MDQKMGSWKQLAVMSSWHIPRCHMWHHKRLSWGMGASWRGECVNALHWSPSLLEPALPFTALVTCCGTIVVSLWCQTFECCTGWVRLLVMWLPTKQGIVNPMGKIHVVRAAHTVVLSIRSPKSRGSRPHPLWLYVKVPQIGLRSHPTWICQDIKIYWSCFFSMFHQYPRSGWVEHGRDNLCGYMQALEFLLKKDYFQSPFGRFSPTNQGFPLLLGFEHICHWTAIELMLLEPSFYEQWICFVLYVWFYIALYYCFVFIFWAALSKEEYKYL